MFENLRAIIEADTNDLIELARIAGFPPNVFYRGANLKGIDIIGHDLRGIDFTAATLEEAIADNSTIVDGDFEASIRRRTESDLVAGFIEIGDDLFIRGNLQQAFDAYLKSLELAETLAARDPGNGQWQRDLWISYNKIGEVRRKRGDFDGAIEAFQASLAIAERLVARDPNNTTWLRDLSISHARIALLKGDSRAIHDSLNSLPNRMTFEQQLQRSHVEAELTGRQLSVILLGLNRFRDVNDSLSREQGDWLLVEVGSRLQHFLQKTDLVAYFGGDEFAILAREYKKPGDIDTLADRIIGTVTKPIRLYDIEVTIGVSIGITSFPEDRSPADILLVNADLALYHIRQASFSGWLRYLPSMPQPPSSDVVLYDALKADQFEVLYEPIIETSDLSVQALDALICWHHPARGDLMATDFMPEMVDSPSLRSLVEWGLTSATEQLSVWRDLGLSAQVTLAMTLPTPLLHTADLPETIERILVLNGLKPTCLTLNLVENALSDEIVDRGMLKRLSVKGFRLAIDDVDQDALPLTIPNAMPIEQIKIRCALLGYGSGQEQQSDVFEAIIATANRLHLIPIGKEIETADQLSLLVELGCSVVQGPLFARRANAADVTRWLSHWQDRGRDDHMPDLLRHGKAIKD